MENKDDVLHILQRHVKGTPKLMTRESLNNIIADKVQFRYEDPWQDYEVLHKLGEGAGGVVFKCKDLSNKHFVAIKESRPDDLEALKSEIAMMSFAEHENIVSFLDCYQYSGKVYIVIELMVGGCLTRLCGKDRNWTEETMAYVLKQCFQGLEFLHASYRIHRDIKSDNILFDYHGRIKLADFGYAVALTTEDQTRASVKGTPYWMAPELIREEHYHVKVDVWSMGIVALELSDGYPPLMEKKYPNMRIMYHIATKKPPKPKMPGKWSNEYNHFLQRCLVKNPKDRAGVRVLLMHPFLGGSCSAERFAKKIPSFLYKSK